jgi:AraC-like DNA-binding protein
LAELKRRPETHWHKCDNGRLCAVVPIVHQGRCLAAVRFVCPASTSAPADFERQVELLDVLAKEFVIARTDSLAILVDARAAAEEPEAPPLERAQEHLDQQPNPPLVSGAIQHIEEHLADPGLTIGSIARELNVHAPYLGQLFVDHVGQRMSLFIKVRRIELAKGLLSTTDRQIKDIARQAGYANPNWFCYVFRDITGLTAGIYRRQARAQSPVYPRA